MTADEIIARARECLGTPFFHQGRLPGMALDCAGVAVHVAKGWHEVEEPAAYSRHPHQGELGYWLDRQPYLSRIAPPSPQSGDVLLMRFGAEPQHLSLCAGDTIIHAYEAIGKTVEHNLDVKWRRRIVAVYRFKDIQP